MTGLIAELRRRKVFRVAAIYIVGAWVVIQVAGEASEAWGIADHVLRYIWIAALLGFPFALVVGWRYDIVDGRIVRTHAADPARPADLSLKRADYVVLAALAVVITSIGFGILQRVDDAAPTAISATEDAARALLAKSIAVLPFDNLSGDASTDPFAAGIHDDILTNIAKISDVKVISRTSVARLDPAMSVGEIGELLRVATVLEGGIQRAGNQLRINVQLIDAVNDHHLWAETFDRELTTQNIFAIQTEIAQAVATALRASLSAREQRNLTRIPTTNLAAYEDYLLGGQQMAARTIPLLEAARDSFSSAVTLDSDFALARVGLANTLLLLNNYGAMPLDQAVDEATAQLERALQIDPDLAAAHSAVGLSFTRRRLYDEAGVHYRRSIELDPNYAPAFHWYGDTLMYGVNDPESALPLLERARELDPLSPVINVTLGEVFSQLGRFDEALAQFNKVLSIEPDYASAYFEIAVLNRFVYGKIDEGLRLHVEELRRDPNRPGTGIAFAYLDLGDDVSAEYWVDEAVSRHPDWYWPIAAKSQLHRYRGEADAAVESAERLHDITPANNLSLVTLLSFDRDARVLEIAGEYLPQLDCNAPAIGRGDVFPAINVSLAHERLGNSVCAERLLDAALVTLKTLPRLGGRGYGIADAEIYARQGKTDLAIATIRDAMDAGWRSFWWAQGPASPHNASIVDDPRFIELMDEIRADMEVQLENVRQWEAAGEFRLD